jgi:IS30 family transposase
MGRSKSAVWNEWKRNRVNGRYVAKKADHKAYVRRQASKFQGKKIVGHPDLKKAVDALLRQGLSPETVAGRIRKRLKHLRSVSRESVARYLGSVYGRAIENFRNRMRARRKAKRRGKSKSLDGRTSIEKRPKHIAKRTRVGDAEADFIVSGKSGKGILLVVVDRKLRMKFIERILPASILNMEQAFLRIKKRYPEMRTVTTDNDLLFAKHERLARLLKVKIYFCHPYSSWEKGTVENANKSIRQFIPKGSDISKYSKRFIERVERTLNDWPMKCLDYRTPQEAMKAHRKRRHATQKPKNARKRRRSN